MSSTGPPSKKPSGARPNVRRLISKDSLPSLALITKHVREPSQTDKSGEPSTSKSRFHTNLPPVGEIKRAESEPQTWVNEEFVTSPVPTKEDRNPFEDVLGKTVRLNVSKPTLNSDSSSSLPFSKEGSTPTIHELNNQSGYTPPPHSPHSPSKVRWDQIRQHILTPSEAASPDPSFTSFSQLNLSAPSQVGYVPPKIQPSRLAARFGFRQVVVEAREANDLTRQYSEDIHKACWAVRFGDNKAPKLEREGTQQSLGSTLHLPFMSSGSLPLSANASSSTLSGAGSSFSKHVRGATSVSNLISQTSSRMNALSNLREVIMRYGVYVSQEKTMTKFLPSEKEILSVLLLAFLNSKTDQSSEDERRISLDIFEMIIQSWKTADSSGELERCLWCCKAAHVPIPSLRSRLLYLLSALISSSDSPISSPMTLPSVLSSLILLVVDYNDIHNSRSGTLSGDSQNLKFTHELISKIISGEGYNKFDPEELEPRYRAITVNSDNEKDLRQGVCLEVIVRCLETGTYKHKSSVLRVVEKYWEIPDLSFTSTPLRSKIHLTKIVVFLRTTLHLLRTEIQLADKSSLVASDLKLIGQLVTNRIIPEVNHFTSSEELANEARSLASQLVLLFICCEKDEEVEDTFVDPEPTLMQKILLNWLNAKSSPWKDALLKELKESAMRADWVVVVEVAKELLSVLPDTSKRLVAGLITPQFQERLVDDPPISYHEPLASLFTMLASIFPQAFYKPLFVCAASTKEETIAHQLSIVIAIAAYMPSFWIGDAEMMSVALMSDPTGLRKGKTRENEFLTWGKPRLGQIIILLELIGRLRSIRISHDGKRGVSAVGDVGFSRAVKFATALENRLAVLIDAREQTSLMVLSQRTLFASLLLETRLITGSLKSTAFLSRVVAWTVHHNDELKGSNTSLPIISEDNYHEVEITWEKIRMVYSLTKAGFQPKNQRRSTVLFVPKKEKQDENSREETVEKRLKLLDSLSTNPLSAYLEVTVALYSALVNEELIQLGTFVWEKCLLLNDTKAVVHGCFVCMLCADRIPDKFMSIVTTDLRSPNALTRRESVQKISIISNWRFQLLSLTYLTDRTRRHPFKLARPPFSFVATDVGETNYVPVEDDETAGGQTHALPLDIRRRLHEIGWDDEEKQTDQLFEWRRTPMSLLGINQLDQISTSERDDGHLSDQSHSPTASPNGSPSRSSDSSNELLRRNSSNHGRSGKRRPVFVLPMTVVFKYLVYLTMDSDFEVSTQARDILIDYMRDDPAILCRPAMESLSKDSEVTERATSILNVLLHLNRVLPPRLTHYVFNHLAGFLKTLAKDASLPNTLHDFAVISPVLSKLTPQVSDMSIRAIRRAKIEIFLFPSANLYFSDAAPSGAMFPRGPDRSMNPFDDCPKNLVDVIMIRMAQNLLFVEMLKRKPQDVHIIRKSWTPLVLPDIDEGYYQHEMIPRRSLRRYISDVNKAKLRLSLSFSRSHLLFIAQVFRCLTRHLNDRLELSMFLDGVNRILTRHGDDIGIVAHSLIVYMIASTRFRRLMSSGNGFTLFLPALIKVYCESESDTAIREAIEYATHRFFALHEETFVYQTLHVVSTLVSQASEDADWIAGHAYHLLSTLKANNVTNDAAGIRDANKAQEEEAALTITADERPQMFLASFRKEGKAGAEKLQSSLSTEIFDKKRFQPDNIVRMLLTVIAHDPTSQRAEYFLRLFRYFVSPLYDASKTARTVLGDGVEALGNIIIQKMKTKSTDPVHNKAKTREGNNTDGRSMTSVMAGNMQAMRSDYLLLFAAFVKAGGAHKASSLQRALDLVKLMLREDSASSEVIDSVRQFFDMISQTFALRQDSKYATTLLKEFAPIISVHGSIVDLSGLLKNITSLASIPVFANDLSFSKAVVEDVCRAALEVCEMASQEGILSSLKFRPHLVKLLVDSVCLLGTNVVAELERRDPSPAFVCGIVIPFVIQLRTTTELATKTSWTDSQRQEAHQLAWVQLLSYTLNIIQNKQGLSLKRQNSLSRSNSTSSLVPDEPTDADIEFPRQLQKKAKRRPSGRTSVETSIRLALVFVALKAVVLRGEADISSIFPGAWLRISAVLRVLLRDGGAMFALRNQLSSVPPSPIISPFGSTSFTDLMDKAHEKQQERFSSSSLHVNPSTYPSGPPSPARSPSRRNSSQTFPSPRVVDYLTWSLLEFLCLRKSPLMIQFRTYMLEKTLYLSEALQPFDPIGGHISFAGPAQYRSRRSTRPISSLYSKPRPRISSANTTPDGSPHFGPIDPSLSVSGNLSSLPSDPGLGPKDMGTPLGQKGKRPIIHLGVSPPPANMFLSPTFVPSNSMSSNLSQSPSMDEVTKNDIVLDARQAITVTALQSPLLVRNTYNRIRAVQKFLGYSTFLPVPNTLTSEMDVFLRSPAGDNRSRSPHMSLVSGPDQDAEPEIRVWTRRQAGDFILKEAQDLLHAWQVESAFTASIGDGGLSDGVSLAQNVEGIDITFVASTEDMP